MAIPDDVNRISGASVSVDFGMLINRLPLGDGGMAVNNKVISSRSLDLQEITDPEHETVAVVITLSGQIRNTEPLCAEFVLTRPDGTTKQAAGRSCIGTPQSQNWEWWNWIKLGSVWTGPPYDILGPGVHKLTTNIVSGNAVSGSYDLYFEVIGEPPPVEPPENFADILLSFLKDVFLEGITIQAALTKWNILPAWIGNFINSLIDLFTVNIAPEGEIPVRVLFVGGSGVLKNIPKITLAAAERIAAELTESSASKILTLMTKNPAGVRKAILSMSDNVIEKLFAALSKSATGRIALARLMSILREGVAQKASGLFGFPALTGTVLTITGFFFALLFLFKWIGFDFPAYMSNLRKEIPEPAGMAVWQAIESAQTLKTKEAWEQARAANEQYLHFINVTDESTRGFVSINPWLADIYTSASDTQRAQYEIYKKSIEDALAAVVPPSEKVELTITSTPPQARIYVDDVYVFEQTPTTILIDAGSRKITLKLDGYQDNSWTHNYIAGSSETWNRLLDPIAPPVTKGTLIISVEPPDAVITIAGHPEIRTAGTYELEAGSYTILASQTGYYDRSATALVKAGETTNVSISLTEMPPPTPPPPEKATLLIDSNPQGAKIYISGTYMFTLTPFTKELEAGRYVVRLEMVGFETSEEAVYLAAGEIKTYSKTLTPLVEPPPEPPPPETRWCEKENKHIPVDEWSESRCVAEPPPEEEIVIPLEPAGPQFNAWKVTIKGVDSETQQELAAWILVNDEFIGKSTPSAVFLYPESEYNIKLRLKGYHQGEVTFTTEPLPEE